MLTTTYTIFSFTNDFAGNGFTAGDQTASSLTALAGGDGYAVGYSTFGASPNSISHISIFDAGFTVPIDINGNPFVSPHTGGAPDLQSPLAITTLNNGNIVAVFDEGGAGDGENKLLARILTPAGALIGSEIIVSAGVNAETPDIDALSDGGFIITWEFDGDGRRKQFDANGVAQATKTVEGFGAPTSNFNVAGLANGGYVVTFVSGDHVYARIFNTDGTARTNSIQISDFGVNTSPKVTGLLNGGWAVVYNDSAIKGNGGLTLDIFTSTGAPVSGPRLVSLSTNTDSRASVDVMDNGFITVVHHTSTSVRADIFDQTGERILLNQSAESFLLDTALPAGATSVAALNNGRFVSAWDDGTGGDGDGSRVSIELTELTRNTFGDGGADSIVLDSLRDFVTSGGGDDFVAGGGGDDTIIGYDGDDTLLGQAGDDDLFGQDGDDSIAGQAGFDEIFGDEGNDTLLGGDDLDVIDGGAENDLIFGQGGTDFINGGPGNDTINGGALMDSLFGDAGSDSIDGGTSGDNAFGDTGNDTINGGDGNDNVFGQNGDDSLSGNRGADSIEGGEQNDFISGGDGLDTLLGDIGNDSIFGGINDDVILASDGFDVLAGGRGSDLLDAGDGNDSIFGGTGNDTILGGLGNDLATGNEGSDLIITGVGNDTMFGGAGDDLFVIQPGWGADIINDFQAGAATLDVIELTGFGAAFDTFNDVTAAATDVGADVRIDLGGGDSVTLLNVNIADLHPDDFIFN